MDSGSLGLPRRTGLLGRAEECAVLDGLLAGVRRGEGRSLVLRGEAGIGKTALLEHLVEAASDLTVLRAVGVESEMELAYAGLHQLCASLLDQLERLPAPQRHALEIVFGRSSGVAPDRFLVGLAVLSLLSVAADKRPLLCVVDDAQWLDQASALTLALVARRLLAEPVGIVFAARQPGEELQDLHELEVRGLGNAEARALLRSAMRFKLDERVRDRIVAETHGNPLALLELPQGLTATQLAGGFGLPEAQGLSRRIEETFVRRAELLPSDTRLLLLLAAAEPVGDPLLLWRAAEYLGIEPAAAGAAEADGLVALGERVIFRHPLVRSAVYRTAAVQERRRAHVALAEVTDRENDPDRRAWHLAAAVAGPDEEVASELERSAGRAQARGGVAAAAAFLQRAVALTQDPARRADRALAAAHASFQAGAFEAAVGLLDTAEAGPLDESQCARVLVLRTQTEFASQRGSSGRAPLLKAARDIEVADMDLARETYLEALHAALHAGRLDPEGVVEVSEAVLALPPPPDPPRPRDLLLRGLAIRLTQGHTAGAPFLKEALARFRREPALSVRDFHWVSLACRVASDLWDDETVRLLSALELARAREAGLLAAMPFVLGTGAECKVASGDLDGAETMMYEIRAVSEATGVRWRPNVALLLAAFRGRETEASGLIEPAVEDALARGEGLELAVAEFVRSVLYNGLGRYDEAVAAVRHAGERNYELGWPTQAVAELVEAAARSGDHGLAERALERLGESTRASGTHVALGIDARCRALLSEGEEAERLYQEAIRRLGRTRVRPALARAHLLYGEWLRRENRRVDARMHLRPAHEQFAALGMEAFAERARRELHATGEKVRKRTLETRDDLTAQERQIARLARDGLSNPEIGARLFLSPRTVEYHLGKVFVKLGIRSRRELFSALSDTESELAPA